MDTTYWENYYKGNKDTNSEPSLFAQWVSRHIEQESTLFDLGAGNGRDSLYLAQLGHTVHAVDQSTGAVEHINKQAADKDLDNIQAQVGNIVTCMRGNTADVIYSRFSLHSLTEDQERELFQNITPLLREGTTMYAEFRSVEDPKYGKGEAVEGESSAYIYDGHYRRFFTEEHILGLAEEHDLNITYLQCFAGWAPVDNTPGPAVWRMVVSAK